MFRKRNHNKNKMVKKDEIASKKAAFLEFLKTPFEIINYKVKVSKTIKAQGQC